MPELVYATFSRRLVATIIDTILITIFLSLFIIVFAYLTSTAVGGEGEVDLLLQLSIAIITIILWLRYGATPGKMLLDCHIVDAATGAPLRPAQSIVRYFGYLLSTIPLGLGFLWIIWHPKKQAFHDLLARTVVIHQSRQERDSEAEKSLSEQLKEH
ncbi:MAG: RDD family protein [Gammaproteobacteria bacterium]|nr:RDD family protein [Gammaproteobacteria bacterium]